MRYIWDGPISKAVTSLLTGAALVFGVITGGVASYDALGDLKPATQGHVKIELGKFRVTLDRTAPIIADMQIEQAEGKLEATEEWLAKWKAEAANIGNTNTAIGLAHGRIRDLERQKEKLERQIEVLNKAKAER